MNDLSSVFVKQNRLDLLMLVLGHEIGHVISLPLNNPFLEEAKAFAFELAWMHEIYRHDIAGLKNNMNLKGLIPSNNGLHDRAFLFVRKMLTEKSALDIFTEICKKRITIEEVKKHPYLC